MSHQNMRLEKIVAWLLVPDRISWDFHIQQSLDFFYRIVWKNKKHPVNISSDSGNALQRKGSNWFMPTGAYNNSPNVKVDGYNSWPQSSQQRTGVWDYSGHTITQTWQLKIAKRKEEWLGCCRVPVSLYQFVHCPQNSLISTAFRPTELIFFVWKVTTILFFPQSDVWCKD